MSVNGRALTENEIREARRVFGDNVDYRRPRIFAARHPLATKRGQVLAPDGNIYWPEAAPDLVTDCEANIVATFIHEMTHVYQHQSGRNVLASGCVLHLGRILSFGRYDPYRYRYEKAKPFIRYNIEQQAEIAVGIYFGWYPNVIRASADSA